MRKLVTLRKVNEIIPINGADFIELVRVDGWQCVVKKGEFSVGDYGIYFEIDSLVPLENWSEFLFKTEGEKRKGVFRIKTIKLKNQLSQGLLIPLKALQGKDLSSAMNVIKYEPPIPSDMSAKSRFPSWISKTNEERIQNLVNKLEEYSKHKIYISEKLNGSSLTCYCKKNELINQYDFGICSRNLELKLEVENDEGKIVPSQNRFVDTVRKLGIEEKMREWCKKNDKDLVIQGELIGDGIQQNNYKFAPNQKDIRFFTVQDGKHGILPLSIIQELDLQTVPILETGVYIVNDLNKLLEYAEGKSVLNNTTEREGIVVRALDNSFSFKVISNKFLLKNKE